ncbi:MAG: hypothetical protein AB7H77_00710 [Bdellovibrionales bacterium]
MKLVLFIFAFAGMIAPSSAAYGQNVRGCNSWPDVPVYIHTVFDAPRYDLSQNLAGLQEMTRGRREMIPQYHSLTMGVTRYEPVIEFHVPVQVEQLPDGIGCAYVQHVEVTMGYRDVTIFVASEIPQNSCGFSETMAHEHKHIEANREVLDKFEHQIEARFKAYLRLNGVFRVQNTAYAERLLHDKLKAIINDVVEKMSVENARRQREVDTREEYTRLANACNGELSRIAQDYRIKRR